MLLTSVFGKKNIETTDTICNDMMYSYFDAYYDLLEIQDLAKDISNTYTDIANTIFIIANKHRFDYRSDEALRALAPQCYVVSLEEEQQNNNNNNTNNQNNTETTENKTEEKKTDNTNNGLWNKIKEFFKKILEFFKKIGNWITGVFSKSLKNINRLLVDYKDHVLNNPDTVKKIEEKYTTPDIKVNDVVVMIEAGCNCLEKLEPIIQDLRNGGAQTEAKPANGSEHLYYSREENNTDPNKSSNASNIVDEANQKSNSATTDFKQAKEAYDKLKKEAANGNQTAKQGGWTTPDQIYNLNAIFGKVNGKYVPMIKGFESAIANVQSAIEGKYGDKDSVNKIMKSVKSIVTGDMNNVLKMWNEECAYVGKKIQALTNAGK